MSSTYKLIILGRDSDLNHHLDLSTTNIAATPFVELAACRPCIKTKRVVVSDADPQNIGGPYVAGPNDMATDTSEIYVIEFATIAQGRTWMFDNRAYLVGKQIYAIDDITPAPAGP